MKTLKMTWTMLAAASLLAATGIAAGCSDDEGATGTTTATTGAATTGATTTGGDATTGGSTTTGGEDAFVFSMEEYDAYKTIDRHGAVEAGTVGIAVASGLFNDPAPGGTALRDDYNNDTPKDDAAGKWLTEIGKSVGILHDALDDDLLASVPPFVPATDAESLAQAGPVLVPDTIKYDPSKPTLYPNGRALKDPVIDITLAAALLKLGGTQGLDTFSKIPLNPPANDVAFKTEFPFLADPH